MVALSLQGVQRLRKVTASRALRGLVSALAASIGVLQSASALGRDGSPEAFAPPPSAPDSTAFSRPQPAPGRDTAPSESESQRRLRQWMLSLEGVTHAPVDFGIQVGAETPFGLHVVGGVGFIPAAYSGLLRGIAGSATSDTRARALIEQADYTGSTWRLQVGIRPFKQVGLYLDGGYAHVSFSGALNLSQADDPQLAAIGGGYESATGLDMWLIELGYQGEIKDRLLLGMALGVMRTFSSHTTISRADGSTAAESPLLAELGGRADRAFESYGIIPTLTLRVGVDLL